MFSHIAAAEEFLYQDHLGRICLLNAANRTERVLMSNVTFVSTFPPATPLLPPLLLYSHAVYAYCLSPS